MDSLFINLFLLPKNYKGSIINAIVSIEYSVLVVYAGKFPALMIHQESLESKVNETKALRQR